MLQVLPVNEEGRGAARQRRRRMLPVVRNPPRSADRPSPQVRPSDLVAQRRHLVRGAGMDQLLGQIRLDEVSSGFCRASRATARTEATLRCARAQRWVCGSRGSVSSPATAASLRRSRLRKDRSGSSGYGGVQARRLRVQLCRLLGVLQPKRRAHQLVIAVRAHSVTSGWPISRLLVVTFSPRPNPH